MTTELVPGTTLEVCSICLGTGGFGSNIDRAESFAILDKYVELGGNFLDTAHCYGDWAPGERAASERTIGAWLADRKCRASIVVATKGAHWSFDRPRVPRLSRDEIVTDLDESLVALGLEQIDLYWLHRDDPRRPVEDILQTLNDQVNLGKIRYFGASNWASDRIGEAQDYASKAGLRGFVSDQVLWNAEVLRGRPNGDPELGFMDEDRFDFHVRTGMSAIVFQSQASGHFQKLQSGSLAPKNLAEGDFQKRDTTMRRYHRMMQTMDDTGLSMTQVVLGYLRGQPFPTIPIVGSRTTDQISDSMTAVNVRLTKEQVALVDGA